MSSIFATTNRLLSSLSSADLALLTPHLVRVPLETRQSIEKANEDIAHAYFVESGMVSIVARSREHESIEAGVIGFEGATGIAVIMRNHRSPHEAFVQLAGGALRIETAVLRNVMKESDAINRALLHFVHVFNIQVAHTALANGRATIEERLSRWLLMVHDRIVGDEVELTHEFIAVMLGVRRPGVTDALHALEGKGLIRSTRGVIRIVDREGLEALASGTYGVPEAEYRRLIGDPPHARGER
jgi:CRP-like cAMP-binding protein